jgi:hypothetical protein
MNKREVTVSALAANLYALVDFYDLGQRAAAPGAGWPLQL